MAPLPVAAGVVRVKQNFHDGSRNWTDSFHIRSAAGTPWTVEQLDALGALVNPLLATVYSGVMQEAASGGGTSCIDLSDDEGREGGAGPGWNGASTGTELPISCTMCTTFVIPRRYRGGHPRFNCSGIGSGILANTISWVPTDCTEVDSGWRALLAAVASNTSVYGGDISVVSLSYYLAGALREVPAFYQVTDVETQQRVCTLRKRLGKPLSDL